MERDLKRFLRNPLMVTMVIVLPLVYLMILGNAMQGKLKNLSVVIVDKDNGPYSRRVRELLQAIEIGPKTVRVTTGNEEKKAISMVKEGIYRGALIIPSDFSRKIDQNRGPEIGLFLDNTESISSAALSSAINLAIANIKTDYMPKMTRINPIILKEEQLFKKTDYDQSLIPGVVVMAIFMATTITGVFNIVMDRFLGINEGYLLTPITKRDLVLGNIMSGIFLTTFMSLLVFISSLVITGMGLSIGIVTFFLTLLLIVITSFCLLSMVFLLMGRANHPRILGIFGGFMNVIFFFPSGAVYPVESFPKWLRVFAKINPEAYAVHAFKSVLLKGAGIGPIMGDLLFLSIFTLVMSVLAVVTFKRTL